ncbi:hypothetical protein VNI00_013491 [Paramarasmius palmivorus]|uniref:Uncharacterized protein n=1 Tax=Paramarasmius palmivorus TaxID=297713 RepID=A0AAW0BYC5_9AGAR
MDPPSTTKSAHSLCSRPLLTLLPSIPSSREHAHGGTALMIGLNLKARGMQQMIKFKLDFGDENLAESQLQAFSQLGKLRNNALRYYAVVTPVRVHLLPPRDATSTVSVWQHQQTIHPHPISQFHPFPYPPNPYLTLRAQVVLAI